MWRAATIAGSLVLTAPVASASAGPPALSVVVVTDAGFARPGGLLSYGITVRNPGTAATAGRVTVLSRLARGIAVVDLGDSGGAGCRETAGSVACALPGLAARQTAEIWITTVVRAAAARTLRTLVTARTPGFRDAAAAVSTPVVRGADLALRLHAGGLRRVVALTTVVRNRSTRRARGVVLHLGLGRAVPLRLRGARCHAPARWFLRCPLGPLAAGARRVVRLTLRLPRGGPGEVAASVTPDIGDPHPSDNTALATLR